ncbi:RNA polymerase sigma factor [Paenibacillus albidus]|uniref:RNA polymerase sigma factor n=1 Tax=Paenibacillus albidus TaxID=2041023 RepID=UPI001BE53257|nr:RNA polymerase sigma factor [Paenibacillus albidus]MBT2293109.1 RNA polymerase sigma factor [Paenibacillus albidus]
MTLPEKRALTMIILEEQNQYHTPDERNTLSLQAALSRYCLSLTKSPREAEDLAQETWIKALEFLDKIKLADPGSHPNPEALLLRIAKHAWIDQTRRKSVFFRVLKLVEAEAAEPAVILEQGSFEIKAVFQALLVHLSPLQQAVFLLREVFHYSAAEVAERIGTSEGAVKAALHRARQALPAVREELLADGLPLPQDAAMADTLEQLASAYVQGEIDELIGLVQSEAGQGPVMAVSSQMIQTPAYGGPVSGGLSYAYSGGVRMVA